MSRIIGGVLEHEWKEGMINWQICTQLGPEFFILYELSTDDVLAAEVVNPSVHVFAREMMGDKQHSKGMATYISLGVRSVSLSNG